MTKTSHIHRNIGKDTLLIEGWSERTVRVRQTRLDRFQAFDWALSGPAASGRSLPEPGNAASARLKLPEILVTLDDQGYLDFARTDNGTVFLQEIRSPRAFQEGGRSLSAARGDLFKGVVDFVANEGERFWGMGQHQYNAFDQKGLVLPLNQKNSQVTVPLLISSRGYGIFWNNPAAGQLELVRNRTRWVAEQTQQLDYFVIFGPDPATILHEYYRITGFPSPLPEWASGFWQSKLRYETQKELMDVVHEHKKRNLPLSVMVIDYFHWVHQGTWDFDSECWPEPEKMVEDLQKLGIETMISVWPSVSPDSPLYEQMDRNGYLMETDQGTNAGIFFTDTHHPGKRYLHFYDATNRDAGDFVWSQVKKNYLDRGIKIFWLDACEPETIPYDYGNLRFKAGNGAAVASLYPMLHEKIFYENMIESGVEKPLNLCRSAWAGSQKYGAAVWSGDIDSTFESLEIQIKAGLNMVTSGIPWWTSDIGGFFGGEIETPYFRELIVRWFQFGLFCPIFRIHGFRNSWDPKKGSQNEIWCFGDEAYELIKGYLHIRENMRPYIQREAEIACASGYPLMRPLIFDFHGDEKCMEVDDEFMFGSEVLVAPVYKHNQRRREVYLPEGDDWLEVHTGLKHEGGTLLDTQAPLSRIPVFLKGRSTLEEVFKSW